jgi:hypothetical protein
MKVIALGLLTSLVAIPAWAASPPKDWQPGFSGNVQLMVGYSQNTSQFNTERNYNWDRDNSGQKDGRFIFGPLGDISYTFPDAEQQISFGTKKSDVALGRFHAELSIAQRLPENSRLILSYIPGFLSTETWEDPYLLNDARTSTKTRVRAMRLQYKNILGSQFSFDSAVGRLFINLENNGNGTDLPSEDIQSLTREGNFAFSEGSYMHYLGRGLMLRTALNYTHMNAKGQAMTNNNYGGSVTVIQFLPSSSLAMTLSYNRVLFEDTNPVFDQTQKNNKWGAFLAYQYKQPFGWKNWGWVNLLGYSQTQSNIAFYDANSWLLSTGLSYKF